MIETSHRGGYNKQRARLMSMYALRNKVTIVSAMGGACYVCGEDRIGLLQLDHRDPSTKRDGSQTLWNRTLTAVVWAEVWLCDLLCATCHTIRHFKNSENVMSVWELHKLIKGGS